jgi:hypothetical protein
MAIDDLCDQAIVSMRTVALSSQSTAFRVHNLKYSDLFGLEISLCIRDFMLMSSEILIKI